MRYSIDEKGMQKATPEVNPNHIKPNDFGVDEKASVFEQLFLSIGKAKALPGLANFKKFKVCRILVADSYYDVLPGNRDSGYCAHCAVWGL